MVVVELLRDVSTTVHCSLLDQYWQYIAVSPCAHSHHRLQHFMSIGTVSGTPLRYHLTLFNCHQKQATRDGDSSLVESLTSDRQNGKGPQCGALKSTALPRIAPHF